MNAAAKSAATSIVAIALTVCGLACANKKQASAQKLSPDEVPHDVMSSINTRFPGADVTSVEKENEHGNVVYDFELKQSGRKYEADVKDDGTIMEIEKQVDRAAVPDAVTRAVSDKYPGATVKEVMEVNKVSGKTETPDHYEVTLTTSGGKDKEVNVSKDGKVSEEAADEK